MSENKQVAWLITGGAGFIGANFVQHVLLDNQPSVKKYESVHMVILDKLTYAGNLASLSPVQQHQQYHFVKGDIGDEQLVAGLFAQYDIQVVINFAAESHVDRSILGPQVFIETNVKGTLNLLQQTLQAWDGDFTERLFLHVSTDEVYGSLNLDAPAFNEQNPYQPNSPYAASKASSDHLVRAWYHTYGLPTIITNCSNNYGPWQFPEKLIPLVIGNILDGQPLPIYGDGLQRRDWLHVIDHCQALLHVIDCGEVGESYCIGGNNEMNNIDIVKLICRLMDDKGVAHDGERLIEYVTDRPGHDRRYAIDASKLKAIGWQAKADFSQAINDTIDWYLAHRQWVDEIKGGEYRQFYQQQYASHGGV